MTRMRSGSLPPPRSSARSDCRTLRHRWTGSPTVVRSAAETRRTGEGEPRFWAQLGSETRACWRFFGSENWNRCMFWLFAAIKHKTRTFTGLRVRLEEKLRSSGFSQNSGQTSWFYRNSLPVYLSCSPVWCFRINMTYEVGDDSRLLPPFS